MSLTEDAIEQEIREKGLDAPRLSPDEISDCISAEAYYVFPGTVTTVCCLTLRNGYTVIGHSAPISADNFDPDLGKKIARSKARDQIWALEGYARKIRLMEM